MKFLEKIGFRRRKRAAFVAIFTSVVAIFVGRVFWGTPDVPSSFSWNDRTPTVFPDYLGVAVPPNIAPLNFDVQEPGVDWRTRVSVADVSLVDETNAVGSREIEKKTKENVVATFAGKKIRFPLQKWRRTLKKNVGKFLRFETFVKTNDDEWMKFNDWEIRVTSDPIDSWVSYRLIEPGYERFSDLEIESRSLESFEKRPLFRARLVNERTCVNCHSFQDRKTDSFLFHLRGQSNAKPGTVLVDRGKAKKIDLNADGLTAGCAYPAWNPTAPFVAFSTNLTFQIFHTKSLDRINVMDAYSDLVLYDVEKNELTSILPQGDEFLETYPTWAPDGKTLYYCSAKSPDFKTKPGALDPKIDWQERKDEAMDFQNDFHYNLMRVSFDPKTRTFGTPELVFDAAKIDKTAVFPRVSPDGKTLLFTVAKRGCFTIWYRDADLWTIDLATGAARALDEVNSPTEPDSYHSWDSSGRWFVFSSRRDDGSHTRLYLAHFDELGRASKPFLLPQRDPIDNLTSTKSYNIPETTVEPIKITERTLLQKANGPAEKAVYR